MDFVLIGKILNTHGIKGELKVASFSDFDNERFKKGTPVYVGEEKKEFIVSSFKQHNNLLLVTFKDNEDINLVEKYKNQFIYKNAEDIKPLKKGEYYFSQLRDLDVYINGECIGKVLRVEEGMTHNNLRIMTPDKKEHLIPYIKDVFVESVDLENKRINYKDIEGLL